MRQSAVSSKLQSSSTRSVVTQSRPDVSLRDTRPSRAGLQAAQTMADNSRNPAALQLMQAQRWMSMHQPKSGVMVQRVKAEEESPLEQMAESEARKYVADAFKKGSYMPPQLDESGKPIQRKPSKSSYDGGELFVVSSSDLDTGTDTTTGTRDYVNNSSTFKPTFVQFNYLTAGSKPSAISNTLVYSVDNPQSSLSYSSGSFYDAGHKLASQNGGKGDDNDWVFPQNPAFNQGNSRLMKPSEKLATGKTHPQWRAHEQYFHDEVKKNGYGAWWIELT